MSVEICRLPPRRAYVKRDSDFQTANLTAHQYKTDVRIKRIEQKMRRS